MPLVVVIAGLFFLIAAFRGTLQTKSGSSDPGLLNLIAGDFTDPNGSFLPWILALGLVGATGYVRPFKPVANAFLVLLLIVFLLAANKGGKDFFSSLANQILKRPASHPITGAPAINPLTDPSLNLGLIGQFTPIGG